MGATQRPGTEAALAEGLPTDAPAWKHIDIVDREVDERGPSATLLTTRALLLRLLDDVEGAAAATDHAASVARTLPERLAVLFQRLNLAVEVGTAARPDLAIAEIERLLPSLDPESRLMAHAHLAGACGGLGELLRCRHHLDAAATLEGEGVLDVDWPWSFAGHVVLDVQQARWDEAIRTYDRGSPEFGPGLRLLSRNHAATSALDVPLHRQDVETARRLAADVVDIGGSGAYSRGLAEAVVDRLSGRPDMAIERLDALVAGASRLPMRGVALLAHLAYAHEESGGRDQARQALDQRRDLAVGQDSAYANALLNLLEARFRDDVDAGRAGAETAAANGLVQYEAACRLELGRLGFDAAPNLLAAHAVFRSVGAAGYVAAAEAEMRRHGVRAPARRRRDPWALSDAEQRVVTLVAEGLTNRAIAERLSYSVKTIEAYLSRVYAKTGCANRVELVNHLAARGRVTSASSTRSSR